MEIKKQITHRYYRLRNKWRNCYRCQDIVRLVATSFIVTFLWASSVGSEDFLAVNLQLLASGKSTIGAIDDNLIGILASIIAVFAFLQEMPETIQRSEKHGSGSNIYPAKDGEPGSLRLVLGGNRGGTSLTR